MKKQTNTSVTATFKNGEKKTFETIEEASEVTGLEINSIKARANKPGSGANRKMELPLNGQILQLEEVSKRRKVNKKVLNMSQK